MSVLQASLLPDSAEVGADGWLHIGGCHLGALADEHGTPLFVYDEDHLRARCREAVAAFGDGVAYATKAFLCRAMAALAHEEGMHLDVATGGELHVARAAGVPAERLVLHGNNKSTDELRRARARRRRTDRRRQLRRARPARRAARGRRRRAAGAAPGHARRRGAHPRVRAHRAGRLEVRLHAVDRRGRRGGRAGRRASPSVELVGLHMHIGSQVFVADYFRQAVEVIAPFVGESGLPELSVGGGVGVAYVNGEEGPTLSQWAAVGPRGVRRGRRRRPG